MKTKKKRVETANATTKRQSTIFFFPFAVVEQKALRMRIIGTHCKALGGVQTDVLGIVTQQNKPNMNICLLLFTGEHCTHSVAFAEGTWTHLLSLASLKKNRLNER